MEGPIDVLVVDEDAEVLELTATFLQSKGDRIAVETETDPEHAAERAVNGAFDCVVSDYRMPGMNGTELCLAVREHRELPFFLFTAADRDVVESDSECISGYVRKGAGTDHYEELVAQIERAVR